MLFSGPDGIITGTSDRFRAAVDDEEPDDADRLRGNLQRTKLLEFLGEADEVTRSATDRKHRHIVSRATLGPVCTLLIEFDSGEVLQVMPDGSRMEDWRLIAVVRPDDKHLVVEGGKAEFQ